MTNTSRDSLYDFHVFITYTEDKMSRMKKMAIPTLVNMAKDDIAELKAYCPKFRGVRRVAGGIWLNWPECTYPAYKNYIVKRWKALANASDWEREDLYYPLDIEDISCCERPVGTRIFIKRTQDGTVFENVGTLPGAPISTIRWQQSHSSTSRSPITTPSHRSARLEDTPERDTYLSYSEESPRSPSARSSEWPAGPSRKGPERSPTQALNPPLESSSPRKSIFPFRKASNLASRISGIKHEDPADNDTKPEIVHDNGSLLLSSSAFESDSRNVEVDKPLDELTRELYEAREDMREAYARERRIARELERRGAKKPDGWKETWEATSELTAKLADVSKKFEDERRLRAETELYLCQVTAENGRVPLVVPALLDAFMEISRLSDSVDKRAAAG